MSSRFGLPTSIMADHSILEALASKPPWLPETLYHQLHIAHQGTKFCKVLGNYEMTATGLLPNPIPIIQMFDGELRAQEARFASSWRRNEYIFFLATKLQLYSFALTATGLESTDHSLSAERYAEIFSHSYLTAMSLVQSVIQCPSELPYWTEHQLKYVLDAVFFLIKLIGCSYDFVDEARARNVISQIWQLIRSRSQTENDRPARICSVIEYLSQNRRNQERNNNASVNIKSRMASNLLVDSVWRARDRFSDAVKAQKPLDYTSAAALERLMMVFDDQSSFPLLSDSIGDWDSFFDGLNSESA